MRPLSKEASAALNALKAADPTPEDEARVRKNVERALGVAIPVAGVGAATTATTAKAATGLLSTMGVGAKVVVFVAVTSVTATAVVSLSRRGTGRGEERKEQSTMRTATRQAPKTEVPPAIVAPPEPALTAVAAPPSPAVVAMASPPMPPKELGASAVEPAASPSASQPPAPLPTAPSRAASAPPRPAASPPPPPSLEAASPSSASEPAAPAPPPPGSQLAASPPPPPPSQPAAAASETWDLEVEANFPNCDPGTELRSAQSARALLYADRAEDALWLLGAYQRRCPSGRWSNDAWSVRIAGLCKLNRTAEGVSLLQWFSTEYPTRREAVLTELRSFCSDDVLERGEP